MDAKLVVVGGESQEAEYSLQLPTIVGRSRGADLRLQHPLVSRKHCEFFEQGGRLMIRDLNSLNGTFVGDARISEATELAPGDLVTVGSVVFRAVFGNMPQKPIAAAVAIEHVRSSSEPDAVATPQEQTMEMSNFDTPIPIEGHATVDVQDYNLHVDSTPTDFTPPTTSHFEQSKTWTEQPAVRVDDDGKNNFYASLK
jgi:pSer/pThr/pTyr-binding forkhead associated (FHA) protein